MQRTNPTKQGDYLIGLKKRAKGEPAIATNPAAFRRLGLFDAERIGGQYPVKTAHRLWQRGDHMSVNPSDWPERVYARTLHAFVGTMGKPTFVQLAKARKILQLYSLEAAVAKLRQDAGSPSINRRVSMSPLEMEKARDRVHNLRARLSDTNCLLESVSRKLQIKDNDTRNSMIVAMNAIRAVSDDLETVCCDHLTDPMDNALQIAAVTRAKSAVDSGEFDSQA